jgi:hypothetical protein
MRKGWERYVIAYKILESKYLVKIYLEHPEGDGMITLRWILGKWVVIIRSVWNWLSIVPEGGLWYRKC